MEQDYIKKFWENQADKFGTCHEASWGDFFAIELEINEIGRYIHKGAEVLDVGCANGYSTSRFMEKKVKSITGIDYSEKMIAAANQRKSEEKLGDKVNFLNGDIRKLPFANNSFDIVYTTRVLINLLSWEEQREGINECIRVCRPNGKIIFSEGFWEPLVLLNSLLQLKQLPPLVEHDFNRYLKKSVLEEYLYSLKVDFTNVDFSSIYYLGSRFLRLLVTNPQDYPGYSNPINEIFYNIEKEFSGGGFGIQQIYVITKSEHS